MLVALSTCALGLGFVNRRNCNDLIFPLPSVVAAMTPDRYQAEAIRDLHDRSVN